MAWRSRMAPARASGVASDPCAAAMRTMTSAYAAMTRLCSLAYPNHATPPRRRAPRTAPVRTRRVRREGAIIAREDLSNTAVRTRGTEASPARHAARRSEEHTSELQSQSNLVCRLLLEKKKLGSADIGRSNEEISS